jgi:predicted Fe-Mo cluster-binding NifX family protein
MKIAVASDDGKTIASHLGRVRGFIIYEIGPGQVRRGQYLENTFTGHARGLSGAGHGADRHGPILEALKGCKAVIAHGMGRRIHDDLTAAGIEAYVVDESDPDVALEAYLRGALVDHPDRGCDHAR